MPTVPVVPLTKPDMHGVSIVKNMVVTRGMLRSGPQIEMLDNSRVCDLGVYVAGYKTRSLVLTAGKANQYQRAITFTATRNTQSVTQVADVTSQGEDFYSWAAMAGRVYGCNGGQVAYFDPQTFAWGITTFATGPEATNHSYIVDPLRCRLCVVHLGRMFYAGFNSTAFNVSRAVDPNSIDDPTVVTSAGYFAYGPQHVVWSDAGRPANVQALNFVAIDDADAVIQAIVPIGSGPDAGLLILANRGMWLLQGYDAQTRVLTSISRTVGCAAPQTVRERDGVVYWMGLDGFYKWSMDSGISRVGECSRYWLREGSYFGQIEWEPQDEAVAMVGAIYPYYAVTCPRHWTTLYIDLVTGCESVLQHRVGAAVVAPSYYCGLGTSGIMSTEVDAFVGTTAGLYQWRWDTANTSRFYDWTVLGPVIPSGDEWTCDGLRITANEGGGALAVTVFAAESASPLVKDGTSPTSTEQLHAAHAGPFAFDSGHTFLLAFGDTTDEARFLTDAATTGPSFLTHTATPPTVVWPRFVASQVGVVDLQPDVRGRAFYVALSYVKDVEPVKVFGLDLTFSEAK